MFLQIIRAFMAKKSRDSRNIDIVLWSLVCTLGSVSTTIRKQASLYPGQYVLSEYLQRAGVKQRMQVGYALGLHESYSKHMSFHRLMLSLHPMPENLSRHIAVLSIPEQCHNYYIEFGLTAMEEGDNDSAPPRWTPVKHPVFLTDNVNKKIVSAYETKSTQEDLLVTITMTATVWLSHDEMIHLHSEKKGLVYGKEGGFMVNAANRAMRGDKNNDTKTTHPEVKTRPLVKRLVDGIVADEIKKIKSDLMGLTRDIPAKTIDDILHPPGAAAANRPPSIPTLGNMRPEVPPLPYPRVTGRSSFMQSLAQSQDFQSPRSRPRGTVELIYIDVVYAGSSKEEFILAPIYSIIKRSEELILANGFIHLEGDQQLNKLFFAAVVKHGHKEEYYLLFFVIVCIGHWHRNYLHGVEIVQKLCGSAVGAAKAKLASHTGSRDPAYKFYSNDYWAQVIISLIFMFVSAYFLVRGRGRVRVCVCICICLFFFLAGIAVCAL
jgi:hypothetical protein